MVKFLYKMNFSQDGLLGVWKARWQVRLDATRTQLNGIYGYHVYRFVIVCLLYS